MAGKEDPAKTAEKEARPKEPPANEFSKIRTHIVLKPFNAGKRNLKPGERVDASGWRNVNTLVNTRYLAPIHQEVYSPDEPDKVPGQGR